MVNLDTEYERKKADVRDEYRRRQIEIMRRLREARHLVATGAKEFEGEPVRSKILSISAEYDQSVADMGKALREFDAERRKLADERSRKHPWSF